MALAVAEGQPSSGVGTIPLIVDLDAHVVEPPDVWSSRLPARLRGGGPHIEYMPGGVPVLRGSSYVESPGTEGPDVAWWCYEDHRASIKRTIAAAGFAPPRGPTPRRDLRRDAAGLLARVATG